VTDVEICNEGHTERILVENTNDGRDGEEYGAIVLVVR